MRKLKLCLIATIALFAIGMQTTRAAAIDYLTGWTEVTSLPTSSSELARYYYAIVANEGDYMVGLGISSTNNSMSSAMYQTPADPTSDNTKVWMIEYSASYNYALRNLSAPTYLIQTQENNPWFIKLIDQATQSEWTNLIFAYSDGTWTIKNGRYETFTEGDDTHDCYWGCWHSGTYSDMAGNKSGADIGHFKIYRITRQKLGSSTDVTSSYISNPSFELGSTGTAAQLNYSAENLKVDGNSPIYGWTKTFSLSTTNGNWQYQNLQVYTSSDASASGFGNSVTPSDGTYYYFWRQGWTSNTCTLTTNSIAELPKGKYTLSVDYKGATSGGTSNVTIKAKVGETEKASAVSSNFPNKASGTVQTTYFNTAEWTTLSTSFILDEAASTSFIIAQLLNGGTKTNNTSRADIYMDNVRLQYENINGPILAALIAQATSINSETEDLTSAITAAQTVYDGINNTAAYQSTIDDAISTLKSAITTSVAGISMNHRDDLSYLIANVGFEELTAETSDYGTGNGKDYSDGGWVLTTTGSFSYGAVLSYGSGNKINKAAIPATDNAGNTGKAFGLSAGWSGSQIYQTAPITLPAGKYIFKVNTYNAGTSTPLTSKFGFVPTSGDATLSTKTSYAKGSWETEEVTLTLGSATEGCFQFGGVATSGASDNTAKVFYDNITLTYITDLGLAKEAWDEAKAAAEAARDNSDYSNVTGDERTNLETEIGKSEPNTVGGYDDATSNLETATATFIAAKSEYDRYAAEKANADRISTNIASGISAPTTAAGCDAVINSILVAEYNYVNDNFSADATDGYSLGLDTWTFTGTYNGGTADTRGTKSSEHWSGSTRTYYEQGANGWGANSWVANYTKTVTLPAATYVLRVAARGSTNTTASMSVTIGGNTYSEALPSKGGATKGITTGGKASFDDGEFANTNGRGWQWRYLAFTLADETEVTFNFDASTSGNHEWFSICDLALKSDISSVSVTVTSAGFATYVPSYNLDFSETDIKTYKVKVSEKGVATLTQVDEVPANTPVLLHKAGGATENIPVIASADAVSDNDLVAGTGAAVATTDGEYTNMILNNIDSKIGFYFAAGQTVATNRAYLHIATTLAPDAEGSGSRMVMVFDDETTSISEEFRVKSEEFSTARFYNLQGQRVVKPAKGLYIVNGKKVVMK